MCQEIMAMPDFFNSIQAYLLFRYFHFMQIVLAAIPHIGINNKLFIGAGCLVLPGCSGSTSDPDKPPTLTSPPSPNSFFAGDTEESYSACHRISNGERFDKGAKVTGEVFDLAIVGAGLGGLTAAHFYHQQRPGETILLIDNHADFGSGST
jgi:spermidine dehydrogenase